MSSRLIVLKLGGSVITHKKKPLTPNHSAIRRLAKEIVSAETSSLIIVHGGGSFGHPLAKRYKIREGYKGKTGQLLGLAKTHQAMISLNKLVVDALIHQKIPAVAVSPSSCVVTRSSRISTFLDEPLNKLLRIRAVPVLYGDVVLDSDQGFAILSGDQLIAHLAMRFNAARVILGMDVDGLYTADPKADSSAKHLSHVSLQELKSLQQRIGETEVDDVTGGMFGKVRELVPVVEQGLSVFFVNAAKPNNVYKALKSEQVIGTHIEKG